ncbi:hypothetical protein POTOM_018741 [Populus tomentosa]|uniref:Gamma-secretase subunit PEN-2 n=1 Tax=Populus tomentosa TaxID=118781 RepID=A0A8X8D2I5_POPTO|nr:hypothetical protein POTOM_018741 [Populus tomentosa]
MEESQSNTTTDTANPNPIPNNTNSILSSTPVWPTIDGPLGLTEDESLTYACRFYKFGFALLPWLWAVNCFYFWPVLFNSRSFPRIRPLRMPYVKDRRSIGINVVYAFVNLPVKHELKFFLWSSVLVVDYVVHCSCIHLFDVDMNERFMVCCCLFQNQLYKWMNIEQLSVDVIRSAVGFTVFTTVLCSWALTFAIGGEQLFGPVWDKLVMYNVADRLGLTGWI